MRRRWLEGPQETVLRPRLDRLAALAVRVLHAPAAWVTLTEAGSIRILGSAGVPAAASREPVCAPLPLPEGAPAGRFCVAPAGSRHWSGEDGDVLAGLAAVAGSEVAAVLTSMALVAARRRGARRSWCATSGSVFRGRRARERGIPGTGLGLARVRLIVERHRGTIALGDTGDVGTMVSSGCHCTFPATRLALTPVCGGSMVPRESPFPRRSRRCVADHCCSRAPCAGSRAPPP